MRTSLPKVSRSRRSAGLLIPSPTNRILKNILPGLNPREVALLHDLRRVPQENRNRLRRKPREKEKRREGIPEAMTMTLRYLSQLKKASQAILALCGDRRSLPIPGPE